MSATDQSLIRSKDGIAIPQYYNPSTNRNEPITGRDGANAFIEKGRVLKDAFSGSTTITKTYTTEMFGFGIVNDTEVGSDTAADLTFQINGFEITVKPSEAFDDLFEPFQTVTVTATGPYRAVVRE